VANLFRLQSAILFRLYVAKIARRQQCIGLYLPQGIRRVALNAFWGADTD
jgi:hypothetical protein